MSTKTCVTGNNLTLHKTLLVSTGTTPAHPQQTGDLFLSEYELIKLEFKLLK